MRAPVSRWLLAVSLVAWLVVLYVSAFRLAGTTPWPFREEHESLVQVLRGFALIVALLCSLRTSRANEAAHEAAGAPPTEPPKITVSPTACYSCGKELAENERAARVCSACAA
jgi:hypothetical protein